MAVKRIEKQLYKISRRYSSSEFVVADSLDDLARYVAQMDKKGATAMSVTEINLDGTHPRVAITSLKAYKNETNRK